VTDLPGNNVVPGSPGATHTNTTQHVVMLLRPTDACRLAFVLLMFFFFFDTNALVLDRACYCVVYSVSECMLCLVRYLLIISTL